MPRFRIRNSLNLIRSVVQKCRSKRMYFLLLVKCNALREENCTIISFPLLFYNCMAYKGLNHIPNAPMICFHLWNSNSWNGMSWPNTVTAHLFCSLCHYLHWMPATMPCITRHSRYLSTIRSIHFDEPKHFLTPSLCVIVLRKMWWFCDTMKICFVMYRMLYNSCWF